MKEKGGDFLHLSLSNFIRSFSSSVCLSGFLRNHFTNNDETLYACAKNCERSELTAGGLVQAAEGGLSATYLLYYYILW